ncbi:MAG TPA: molybdopterin-dependent oxidoreductase [Albidovulum sp.]|uniref:xanthine dehydrogenase family protein molybdopterin-binding subunit n=1 Tax=Albidovulum sp. TaxID=1872424 RepID=UPI002BBA43A4|nr:molybdopterin-dependent oxidoreductase [Albidovulum sp.]
MGKFGKIARRTFLIGSAAIAGGVAFGYFKYKSPVANPLLGDLKPGQAALTPYVLIDGTGVTLITPRMDMGQGVYSLQAMLIAEELDIGLDQVRVDPGMPSPAYYNTALSHEAVPFDPRDTSMMAETMRGVADAAMKFMGMQMTGGSTTTPDGYEKLRIAGAVARETLKAAAAKRTGVAVADLKTEGGAVVLPDGTRLDYTTLAPDAAGVEPVTEVTLREPEAWRLIGKDVRRIDIVAKSTGTQVYSIDLEPEGVVHAAVRLNPRRSGAPASFDASAAEAMRGVEKVLPVTGGLAVLADNTWRAFQAADAITVEWPAAAYPAEMQGHWDLLSAGFTKDNVDATPREAGDVAAALVRAGEAVVNAEYRAPYLAHAPMEPLAMTVLVGEGRADVWAAAQAPRFAQANVAKVLGLPVEAVHVHVQMAGGSFGHRLEDDAIRVAAEIANQVKGRPVKLTLKREEDMATDYPRQIAMARAEGAVADGKVVAFDLGIAMPSVIASQMGRQGMNIPGPDSQITAGAGDQPFAIPDYRVTGFRVPGLAPVSSWRSVGASTNGFFHDSFLDELIHAAGADPLTERIRLMDDPEGVKVLETVGEMCGWGASLPKGTGRGIGFCRSFGVPVAEVIEVRQTEAGIRIEKIWIAAGVGRVIDPQNFANLVAGGAIFGLSHAMSSEITYADGMVEQPNFDAYEGMRMPQAPVVEVKAVEGLGRVRGIGEPPVPPAAAALANAIFAATGQRIRELPLSKSVDFA